jgi:hypothetical protein
MEDGISKLSEQDELFLVRVADDLRSDVNHVSIFASVCIAVISLIILYVALSFLGSVGNILSSNGGLDQFNTRTDAGFVIVSIGVGLLFSTTLVCFLCIWFINRLRREFDRSYNETENIFRESFQRARKEFEASNGDNEDYFRPRD